MEFLGCHVSLREGRDLSVLVNYLRVLSALDVIRTRWRISLRFASLLEDQDLLTGQVNLLGHFHKCFPLFQIRFALNGLGLLITRIDRLLIHLLELLPFLISFNLRLGLSSLSGTSFISF